MDRTYKSSVLALIRHFIAVLICTVVVMISIISLAGIVLLGVDIDDIFALSHIIVCGIIAVTFSFYFACIRNNVTVKITDTEITLLRGKEAYKILSVSEYSFTSYVYRQMGQGGIYTSRYLRAVNKETKKWKDYRVYFSKKRFEELIVVATSLNEIEGEIRPGVTISISNREEIAEGVKFRISNKEEIVEGAKKIFKKACFSATITCLVMLVIYMIIAIIFIKDMRIILGLGVLIGMLSLLAVILSLGVSYVNYIGITKNRHKKMPSEICITDSELRIDENIYKYEDIKQIRATPPEYDNAPFGRNIIHRIVTVVDKNNKKRTFFMGFRELEKMTFKDYEEFCVVLKKQFKDNPEKFIYEL